MEKCQCSFWRKLCPGLCCCKQVKNDKISTIMERGCSCSIWRKCFCLCHCKQVDESDNEADRPNVSLSFSYIL